MSESDRFLNSDWSAKVEPVPYAKLDNPQSLNLYAYADNNPESVFDPDGHLQQNKAQDTETVEAVQCTWLFCQWKKVNVQTEHKAQPQSNEGSKGDKQKKQTPMFAMGKGRGGQGKGERRQTGKPGGTPNPGKHARWDPEKNVLDQKPTHGQARRQTEGLVARNSAKGYHRSHNRSWRSRRYSRNY